MEINGLSRISQQFGRSMLLGLMLLGPGIPCAALGDSGLIYYGNDASFGGSATDPFSLQGFTTLAEECDSVGLPTAISDVFPVALGDLRFFLATSPTTDFSPAQVSLLQSLLASGGVIVLSHDGLSSPAQNNLLAALGSAMVFGPVNGPGGTDIGTVVDDSHPLMAGLTNGDRFCSFSPGQIANGQTLVQDSIADNIISVEMIGPGAIVTVADFDILNNVPVLFWPTGDCTSADVANIDLFRINLCAFEPVILVDIDIKFCSDPNAFNCKKGGVLPVTIFGTEDFLVEDIDISTLRLCTADLSACTGAPRDYSYADRGNPLLDLGAAMCAIDPDTGEELDWTENYDGYLDLDAAFEAGEVKAILGDFCDEAAKGDVSEALIIIGETYDGVPVYSVPADDNTGIDRLVKVNK